MRITAVITACAFAFAFAFALAPVAFAEDAVPEILIAPTLSIAPGRQVDIRGISPRMALEEVRVLLVEMFGDEPLDWPQQTRLTQSGVNVMGRPLSLP